MSSVLGGTGNQPLEPGVKPSDTLLVQLGRTYCPGSLPGGKGLLVGFTNVSLDLMLGCRARAWRLAGNLDRGSWLQPGIFPCYELTIEESTPTAASRPRASWSSAGR